MIRLRVAKPMAPRGIPSHAQVMSLHPKISQYGHVLIVCAGAHVLACAMCRITAHYLQGYQGTLSV